MDTDYMEKTIYNVLVDNGIDDKKLANEISSNIKDDILKFHKFQNDELMKELLNKQIRIDALEKRIDAKYKRTTRRNR